MKRIEKISNAIHDGVISNRWSSMVDWYRVILLDDTEKERYVIKFYLNYLTEELDLIKFQNKLNKILEGIEDNVLVKLDKEFNFITYIDRINRIDNTIEIIAKSESV